jgi:hypothetical protein
MPRMALLSGAAAAALLVLAPAMAGAATTSTAFTSAGEHPFTVPAGVSSLQVDLTGAPGGSSPFASGGTGATVSGPLTVTPGQTLYAEVGGAGPQGSRSSGIKTSGGSNGGGDGAAGGGGASDIRAFPAALAGSLATRLAVAGGGGGAAYYSGNGGNAGEPGGDASGGSAGGRAGTAAAGGTGGTGSQGGPDGTPGAFGTGGNGGVTNFIGGGGGGGYYGGGGGGGMGPCNPCNTNGGGGGGSSLVPAGGTSRLASAGAAAEVRVTYEVPAAAFDVSELRFASTPSGSVSAGQTVILKNRATSTKLIVSDTAIDTDDFIVTSSTCQAPIAPDGSCRLRVRFAPTATGERSATLTLHSNGPDATLPLTGTALDPTAGPAGPQGPAGKDGANGKDGDNGTDGANGKDGAQGSAGMDGKDGAQGPVGLPGPTGAQGPAGAPARPGGLAVVTCHKRRCSVRFTTDAPQVTAKRAYVAAQLRRNGISYAATKGTARRGRLHLTLKTRLTPKPGAYKLTLTIAGARFTLPAFVG